MTADWGVTFIMFFFLLWIVIGISSIFVSMSSWKIPDKFKKRHRKHA